MTDETQNRFTVTDKRAASQANDETPSSPSEASTPPSASEVPPFSVSFEEQTASPPTSEDESHFLPDPTMLLSIASMQMETVALMQTLLAIFDGHAWRAMGMVADPLTGQERTDLPAARLAIDTVQFLVSKVGETLPEPERREAQRRLSDLQMNYLAQLRKG